MARPVRCEVDDPPVIGMLRRQEVHAQRAFDVGQILEAAVEAVQLARELHHVDGVARLGTLLAVNMLDQSPRGGKCSRTLLPPIAVVR